MCLWHIMHIYKAQSMPLHTVIQIGLNNYVALQLVASVYFIADCQQCDFSELSLLILFYCVFRLLSQHQIAMNDVDNTHSSQGDEGNNTFIINFSAPLLTNLSPTFPRIPISFLKTRLTSVAFFVLRHIITHIITLLECVACVCSARRERVNCKHNEREHVYDARANTST